MFGMCPHRTTAMEESLVLKTKVSIFAYIFFRILIYFSVSRDLGDAR